jgi:hypothetical protein
MPLVEIISTIGEYFCLDFWNRLEMLGPFLYTHCSMLIQLEFVLYITGE